MRPSLSRFALTSLASAIIFPALASAAAAPGDAPTSRIDRITLSAGGMAEIHRQAQVDGPATLSIETPLRQVDDILKSLLVTDPAGGVAGLTLDGLSPVEETFARLPFTAEQMGSVPHLANALAGTRVRATSGGRAVEGVVLGVANPDAESQPGTDGNPPPLPVLSVLADNGSIQVLRLGGDTVLDIRDEAMRTRLREAAAVRGRARADDVRRIGVELPGTTARTVELAYVVAAPVWKTAYRLLTEADGKVRLQAWAVLENATGEDWDRVHVTLSSGAPVMLSQRLHQRYWHERPDIPVQVGATAPPRVDDTRARGGMGAAGAPARMARPAPAPVMAEAAMAPPPPAPSASAQAADAQEGDTVVSFALPQPVTLPAGQTLSVPFIDQSVPGERLSVFQPERGRVHPVAAVMLENATATSLPAGILTVYDTTGAHAGDAQLAGIPAGESRLASFAEDRKVTITTDTTPEERVSDVRIAEGVLQANRLLRRKTTYTIQGAADAPRVVVIEHPRRSGWKFASLAATSETPTHHRLRAEVPAGGTATLEAVAERTEATTLALVSAEPDVLMRWSGAASDDATRKTLTALAEARRALAQAQARVDESEAQLDEAAADQARVRENLGAVPADSALGQRYLKMLEDEETRIAELREARTGAVAERDRLRKSLAEQIHTPSAAQ
ncbi:DUF4139 domain-containing protein [Achromobacter sp. GG226]|uniref:DUF4139 domain-containing protein n=1 Tax=Verticiella alkaliphila TaxID=2779529 RepID=UPI001C0E60D5|nr:DUF4139 domain-containing protein [Verticiella sp. GG226]MBU4609609.1 DUF4139 domain-containing protein [Verticiella sp. GG226]